MAKEEREESLMDTSDLNEGRGRPDIGPDIERERIPGGPIEQAEETAKRVMLAGVGAAATAKGAAGERFDRFVERGEQIQEEWQDRAAQMRQQNAGARWRVQEYFRSAMGSFLDQLNIPSKTDVDTINVKLNILARKLDDLQMDQVRAGGKSSQPDISPAGPPPAPNDDLAT
jgi:poly(hydroxyalkanoate) granule-associated protein